MIKTQADLKVAKKFDRNNKFATMDNAIVVQDNGQRENAECYSSEPCIKCEVGVVYDPEFPNGNAHGTCLNCGAELIWENEDGHWEEE